MGPAGQGTPHVIDTEQGSGAARCWRGQNSPTARLPAVTSSHDDLLVLAHRLSHLAGPIVDGKDDGGGNGEAAGLDHDQTPVEATVVRPKAWTSTSYLRRTRRTS